ncbi:MAG: hypothetical protein ACRDV3_12550, partial [Acidothermaceae bacterium]
MPTAVSGTRRLSMLLTVAVCAALAGLALLVYSHTHPVQPALVGSSAATIVAALAGLVLSLLTANRRAESHQLAFTDELTGLANRRAFYDHVDAHFDRAEQH